MSRYNQILIAKYDRHIKTFITPWGTYAHAHTPFGLKNGGATFQRVMDHPFTNLVGKVIACYQDDLTNYSKLRASHWAHLQQVLQRCRQYAISLNPKKLLFVVLEGRFLGHIVGQNGINIDPKRIKAITKLKAPNTHKGIQSYFGKINFARIFVPNYASIIKLISKLLKTDENFEWSSE